MADPIAQSIFTLLFEVSTEIVLVVSRATGCVVSANVRAAELLVREREALIGLAFATLCLEPEREMTSTGRYEDVGLRRGDGFDIYVELEILHLETPTYGAVTVYLARDTSERHRLQHELLAKHEALVSAYADLERTNTRLQDATRELETRNHEVARLASRAAIGELVAEIAHQLNNPLGALSSTVLLLRGLDPSTANPSDLQRLLARAASIASRIESNVAAIVQASRGNGSGPPIELARRLSALNARLDVIPSKDPP